MRRTYEDDPRGHIWKKNDYDGEVDIFAFETDHHNGPRCVVCGYEFCHHCQGRPSISCEEVQRQKLLDVLSTAI